MALPQSLIATEDEPYQGQLAALNLEGKVTFRVVALPRRGHLDVDAASGAFRYAPQANFFGADSFSFIAENARHASRPALVALQVQPVNDAPTLETIPDLQNSAYERDVRYTVHGHDVDGDTLQYVPIVQDAAIARARIDSATRELTIEPLARGTTKVIVEARDLQSTARTEFAFSVRDVTKTAAVDAGPQRDHAIALLNASDRQVAFSLSHNQFPMMGSDEQMVEYVRAMAPAFAGEPFERKLWRFVRNNTYHWPPLSAEQWINDPWLAVSSLGWGFCSEVAASYARVARAAGYETRVHGLTGHVVPEIKIGGRWRMFDPDLALYYRNRAGDIASVGELVADPTLITAPTDAILDTAANPLPYSDMIASFYASTADNYVSEAEILTLPPAPRPALTLPPQAEFVYPGRWTDAPLGYDGDDPHEVPAFVQGSLTTASGWTGAVPLPLRLAAVHGEGRVRIGGQDLAIGSPQLADALRANPLEYDHIEIVEARSPVRIVMFMNALRYELQRMNDLRLTGQDVWAIEVDRTTLQPEQRNAGNAAARSKPRPIRP